MAASILPIEWTIQRCFSAAERCEGRRRNKVKLADEWFDGSLYSHLNDKTKGAIVIVMQRLREDDLVGHVLKREGFEIVSFAAIAETDEAFEIETPFGRWNFKRRAGVALRPARNSVETLEHIRAIIGEYNFAGRYQQRPAPAGGGTGKTAWFNRYRDGEAPAAFDQVLQSWDTANKPAELADYSVCTNRGLKRPTSTCWMFFGKLTWSRFAGPLQSKLQFYKICLRTAFNFRRVGWFGRARIGCSVRLSARITEVTN